MRQPLSTPGRPPLKSTVMPLMTNVTPTSPATWSPEARTWVSLLLFVHLFAVFVAVTTYTRPSDLQEQLHEPVRALPAQPAPDAVPVSYPFARYYLTHAAPRPTSISRAKSTSRAPSGKQRVTIPDRRLVAAIRFRRYQALANAAGSLAQPEGNEDLAGILPKAIAGSILEATWRHAGRRARCGPISCPSRCTDAPTASRAE